MYWFCSRHAKFNSSKLKDSQILWRFWIMLNNKSDYEDDDELGVGVRKTVKDRVYKLKPQPKRQIRTACIVSFVIFHFHLINTLTVSFSFVPTYTISSFCFHSILLNFYKYDKIRLSFYFFPLFPFRQQFHF